MSDSMDVVTVEEPIEVEPVFGSEGEKKAFVEYLSNEIIQVRDGTDRKEMEEKWRSWRRISQAIPETEVRQTPWIRASSVEPPLTMQKVQTIYAKLIAAFSVKKPPVQVDAFSQADKELADSLEQLYAGLAQNKYGLDVSRRFKQIAYDLVRMGTVPVKVPFTVDKWSFQKKTSMGTAMTDYVRHIGPEIIPIRLEDFFIRPYWKDLQRCPWVAVRYKYYAYELKRMAYDGTIDPDALEAVLGNPITEYDEGQKEVLEHQGIDTGSMGKDEKNQEFEIYEAYCFWEIGGSQVDVIVWIEPDTGTLLRAQLNPLPVRDLEGFTYLEDPNSFYGVGICQMTQSLQEEVTALHRMRLDGTSLSMMKMFVARKGSGIGPKEEFYPFKLMLLDDPAADFREISFPDISQGAILSEQIAQQYADRVTGANDYMAGFNDKTVGSNATASGTTFLAGQANSILNSLLENTEQSMSNVYMLCLYQMMANKSMVDLAWLEQGTRRNIEEVLSIGVENIPSRFRFTVRTTDINKTDESRKQNFLLASQLYNQYEQQALQTLVTKSNPQVASSGEVQELLTSMYVGQTTLMEKMLEFFDVGNPEDFLPFVEQMKVKMRMADELRKQQTEALKEVQRNGQNGGTTGQGIESAAGSSGGVGGILGNPAGDSGYLAGLGGLAAREAGPSMEVGAPSGGAGQTTGQSGGI